MVEDRVMEAGDAQSNPAVVEGSNPFLLAKHFEFSIEAWLKRDTLSRDVSQGLLPCSTYGYGEMGGSRTGMTYRCESNLAASIEILSSDR